MYYICSPDLLCFVLLSLIVTSQLTASESQSESETSVAAASADDSNDPLPSSASEGSYAQLLSPRFSSSPEDCPHPHPPVPPHPHPPTPPIPHPAHCDFKCVKTGTLTSGGEEIEKAGEKINYSVVVTNTGTAPLTVERVSDTMVTLTGPHLPFILAPHTSFTCHGTYTVTEEDLQRPHLTNRVKIATREAGERFCSTTLAVRPLDCPECKCKECCRLVEEEDVRLKDVTVRKCYSVYVPEEKTVPYCCNECKDGKCIEVLGTKTVRQFVQRRVVRSVTEQVPEVCAVVRRRCLHCGVKLRDDCPGERSTPPQSDSLTADDVEVIDDLSAGRTPIAADLTSTHGSPLRRFGLLARTPMTVNLLLASTASVLPRQGESSQTNCVLAPTIDLDSRLNTPDWSDLHSHEALLQCTKCQCKECCSWLADEGLQKITVKVKVGVKIHKPEDFTKPYCDVKCDKGECSEVIGTRTVRKFVPRIVEREVPVTKYRVVEHKPRERCLKCGFSIEECSKTRDEQQTGRAAETDELPEQEGNLRE